jgi:hypothetical protein
MSETFAEGLNTASAIKGFVLSELDQSLVDVL